MTRDQFENLLLVHGADPDGWPDGVREEALGFAKEDAGAYRMLEAIRMADGVVMQASSVPPAGNLASRILAAATADNERAAIDITPAGILGIIAGSAGLAGAGYAMAAAVAAAVVPAGLMETVTAVAASGIPGGF